MLNVDYQTSRQKKGLQLFVSFLFSFPTAMTIDNALLLSGGLGGPFTIWFYTPLRNAITLGSKYQAPGALQLYRMTFEGRYITRMCVVWVAAHREGSSDKGGMKMGWTGAVAPTIFSVPQFLAMGPAYHWYSAQLGSTSLAVPRPHLLISTSSPACLGDSDCTHRVSDILREPGPQRTASIQCQLCLQGNARPTAAAVEPCVSWLAPTHDAERSCHEWDSCPSRAMSWVCQFPLVSAWGSRRQ